MQTNQLELPMIVPTKTPPRFSGLRLLTDLTFAARFWLAAFLLSQLLFFLYVFLPRPQEYVVMVDEAGNVIRAPLVRFRAARGLHVQQARLAAKAFLDRAPAGFDEPDLLELMFLSSAVEKARSDLATEAEERTAKQLHQKAEIESTEVLKTAEQELLVQVRGQLIRAGVFQNRPFGESVRFQLSLKMLRNPDLGQNSRFPLAVADYRYETQ